LEPLRNGVIEKVAYPVELCLIIKLWSMPHMEYFLYGYENSTQNNTDCTLINKFGLTQFGSVMNNL
jgi:hypothetical protein